MSLFPMFLRLDGKLCLIVGAGLVAAEKIDSLHRCGAKLRVVAPEAIPVVKALAQDAKIDWIARPYLPEDMDGVCLVIAATNDRQVNRMVYEEANRRSIFANTVDDPPLCDFFCASIVERGDLQLAISTAGKSPALAQRLRRELDAELDADLGAWLSDLGELRREVLQSMPAGEERKLILHRLAKRELCSAELCPARLEALAAASKVTERQTIPAEELEGKTR
jgi:siroheme synthase-like protein